MTKTVKRYKRFWPRCKNIKRDSLKSLRSLPGNRDSAHVKTDDSRLFSDINAGNSGPRDFGVLGRTVQKCEITRNHFWSLTSNRSGSKVIRHVYASRDSPPSHTLLDQKLDPRVSNINLSYGNLYKTRLNLWGMTKFSIMLLTLKISFLAQEVSRTWYALISTRSLYNGFEVQLKILLLLKCFSITWTGCSSKPDCIMWD